MHVLAVLTESNKHRHKNVSAIVLSQDARLCFFTGTFNKPALYFTRKSVFEETSGLEDKTLQ